MSFNIKNTFNMVLFFSSGSIVFSSLVFNVHATEEIIASAAEDHPVSNPSLEGRDSSTCLRAFEHEDFAGKEWTFFCNGSTGDTDKSWNDKITSMIIPQGWLIKTWQHSDRSGKEKHFIGSVPNVGSDVNDSISLISKSTKSGVDDCVVAYTHANYRGEQFAFCPSSVGILAPEHSRWNDKISSALVPDGRKALFCTDFDRDSSGNATEGGECRSYFEDRSSIGGVYDDAFSFVRYGAFNADDFTLAIISDTQYKYCVTDLCQSDPGDGFVANRWHASSLKKMRDTTGFSKFAGVIVNGDITNVMDKDEIESFITDYGMFNTYVGLGNHDYDNYIDDKTCDGYFIDGGQYRALSQNFCAIRLLEWWHNRIQTVQTVSKDYYYSNYDFTGSLSYSFDIGSWHFVQLHNHPAYEREFSSYDSWRAQDRDVNIYQSLNWLRDDLRRSRGKKAVLNMHVINADRFNQGQNPEEYQELGEIIDENPQVVAIFAGHIHSYVMNGWQNSSRDFRSGPKYFDTPQGRRLPIFYSGSAENNIYMQARFLSDKLEVTPYSSLNGNSLATGSKHSVDAPTYPDYEWTNSIIHSATGLCLDVYQGLQSGQKVITYACTDGENQQFSYDLNSKRIQVKDTNLCLDVYQGENQNSQTVQAYTCNSGTNQQWTLDGKLIKSDLSGTARCMDRNSSGNIILWTCNESNINQQFEHDL